MLRLIAQWNGNGMEWGLRGARRERCGDPSGAADWKQGFLLISLPWDFKLLATATKFPQVLIFKVTLKASFKKSPLQLLLYFL